MHSYAISRDADAREVPRHVACYTLLLMPPRFDYAIIALMPPLT